MRLLADENFPGDAVRLLRQAGYDVSWVRTDAPGSADDEIISQAQRQGRIILTFDKDFGELIFRLGRTVRHGVILFRLSPMSAKEVADFIVTAVKSREDWEGCFSVVDTLRIRMRKLRK